jgi:DNA-binding CsgD family transcriptional regulator
MISDLYKEANKIWKKISRKKTNDQFELDMEVYKKLLDIFMPGDYYYYIFNVADGVFEFVSEEITPVLGYAVEDIDVPFFINRIHKEDQPWFLNFEHKVQEFFAKLTPEQVPNYKVRYDYRIRKNDGSYIRILQQVITIQFAEDGSVLKTLGVHTDISHLKESGTPLLSFIGLNGEPSYYNVVAASLFKTDSSGLSKREIQILRLLAEGRSSDEISRVCFISKQTVNTHRKNLLKKTGCTNAAELTVLAVRKGWL